MLVGHKMILDEYSCHYSLYTYSLLSHHSDFKILKCQLQRKCFLKSPSVYCSLHLWKQMHKNKDSLSGKEQKKVLDNSRSMENF